MDCQTNEWQQNALGVTLFCTFTVIRESNLLGVQAPADHMSCQTNEWQQYALRLTFTDIRESNFWVGNLAPFERDSQLDKSDLKLI